MYSNQYYESSLHCKSKYIMHVSHGFRHTVTCLASSLCVSWLSMVTLRCVKLYRELVGWLELEQRPRHRTWPMSFRFVTKRVNKTISSECSLKKIISLKES